MPFLPLGLEKDIFGWIGICGYREHGGCRRPLHLSFVAQSPEGAITGPKTTFMHLTTWVMQKNTFINMNIHQKTFYSALFENNIRIINHRG